MTIANKNEFGQITSQSMTHWLPAQSPQKIKIVGAYTILEPLDTAKHTDPLFKLFHEDISGWTYLPYGPFPIYTEFHAWLTSMANAQDPLLYTILDSKTNKPLGLASYLRITPEHGVIEVGHLHFSKQLRRTAIATEAMYLMMQYAFDKLGYRRYEWKCDSLNLPSRNAAERLGFKLEGIFRNHMVSKNRNRDTAWFSIIDSEWPQLKMRFEKWLNPANFDTSGSQILSLNEIK